MPRNVTVGVDGSPESRAAAEGAAREAGLLGLPLRVVHAWQPVVQAPLLGVEASRDQAEHMLREVGESLRLRHSRIQVNIEYRTGRPVEALCEAASEAELLVLGSRALGGVSGFVLGSVGLSVAAHAKRPVVFVRAAPRGSWSTPPRGPRWSSWAGGRAAVCSVLTSVLWPTGSCTTPPHPSRSSRTTDCAPA
ncbi:universal stress protein [Streptomyces naganishii]